MQPSEEEGEGGAAVVLSTEAFLEILTYASFHNEQHSPAQFGQVSALSGCVMATTQMKE